MRATSFAHHSYDLLKTETVRDPYAELDHFSLRCEAEEAIAPQRSSRSTEIVRYDSLFELKKQWKRFDCVQSTCRLIVVLLLQAGFKAHLPGLVQRRHPAQRLFITSVTGRWPGVVSLGDLALHSSALGWQEISFHRNPREAISDALQSTQLKERCVLFYPEEIEMAGYPFETPATLHAGSRWM